MGNRRACHGGKLVHRIRQGVKFTVTVSQSKSPEAWTAGLSITQPHTETADRRGRSGTTTANPRLTVSDQPLVNCVARLQFRTMKNDQSSAICKG